MSPIFDVSTAQGREDGVAAAVEAARMGQCIVMPTDTVYGIGTDAFSAAGVDALLNAKGRGRDMPPPVLISDPAAVDGLATAVPSYARRLIETFWPGGLTLVFRSQPSLAWDLGDTNGTVGLRMPQDEVALQLLSQVGPMAVSSANRTGQPVVTTITEAGFAFGPSVEIYLDAGTRTESTPSTILDCTKADPVLLRAGAVTVEQLREVLGSVELIDPNAEFESGQFETDEVPLEPGDIDPSTGERMPVDLEKNDEPVDLTKHGDGDDHDAPISPDDHPADQPRGD